MRIVAGEWAGRHLVSPGGRVRPTGEDLRVATMELVADDLEGARVLDLFAGTGALGLEALSRGAKSADFVENGPPALHALKANVAKFRLLGRARVFKKDVVDFLAGVEQEAYDVAFVDPPYGSRLADMVVERWAEVPFARVMVVEHASDRALPLGGRTRVHGASALTVYRRRTGRRRR